MVTEKECKQMVKSGVINVMESLTELGFIDKVFFSINLIVFPKQMKKRFEKLIEEIGEHND